MNKLRKILLIGLVVCCALACITAIACNSSHNWRAPEGGVVNDGSYDPNNPNGDLPYYYPEGTNADDYRDKNNSYTITTVSMGGLPIDGIRITVKKQGVKVVEGVTLNGGAIFNIPLDNYDLEYSDLPRGYSEDSEGTVKHLTATSTQVTTVFSSSVIESPIPAGYQYQLGDIMYDFRVTDADGTTMVLSEILTTKRAVLLNFWATWCDPCRAEFPAINNVYKAYSETVEVIAISQTDSNAAAKNFKEASGYEFFMSSDGAGLVSHFNTSNIPVSIMIDRYGVVAFYNIGAETNQLIWEQRFRDFSADDYQQKPQQGSGGETGDQSNPDPVAPPEDIDPRPSDAALNQAFLSDSMKDSALEYYEPAKDTRDGKYNWPFHVGDDDPAGSYITPSNIGTDNSWSIIYTDLELEADQTLFVDVKLKSDPYDTLYIIINNSSELTVTLAGETNGWETVELLSATRYTPVNLTIFYNKNFEITPEDEFVGLRNLQIKDNDYASSDSPLDIRTEAVLRNEDGTLVYPEVYLAEDGFYRIRQGAERNPETDSMLFADILSESLWSDLHLKNFKLYVSENNQNYEQTKSVYLISYWHPNFGNSAAKSNEEPLNFGFGDDPAKMTDVIIDNYWIQDGTNYLSPVDKTLATTLKAFAKHASENIAQYEGDFDEEKTWLELCNYYRTLGGSHNAENHICLAHTNPGVGKTLTYAIEIETGDEFTVDLTTGQRKNRAGGLFYKFTAPETGVYVFTSYRPFSTTDPIDPHIIIWEEGSDAYNDKPLLEQADCHSKERFADNDDGKYTNNFMAYIYLTKGQTVYPQLTVGAGDISQMVQEYIESKIDVTYKVDVQYLGSTKHVLTLAATDGNWDSLTQYSAIGTVGVEEIDGTYVYHHLLDSGDTGSIVYIDFLHTTYMSPNMSIEQALDTDYFKVGDSDYTALMKIYLAESKAKDPADPTYGMLPATDTIVNILSSVIRSNSDDGDGLETGAWKGFAYYWQYYGPTEWEELPE